MWGDPLVKAIASAIGGALLGWSAQALTLTGKVDALGDRMRNFEMRLDQLIAMRAMTPPPEAKK